MSQVSFYLGSGESAVPVKVKPYPLPSMQLKLGFTETADGGQAPVPRPRGDIYASRVVAFGTRDEVQAIVSYLDEHRDGVALTGVNTRIFVPLVSHGSTLIAYVRPEVPDQRAFAQGHDGYYEVALSLRAVTYSLALIEGSLSSLRQRSKFKSGHEDASLGRFSYDGVPSYADTKNGEGVYRETFYQDVAETALILQFWRQQRGRSFLFPALAGVDYPFGPGRAPTGEARAVLDVDSVEPAGLHFYLLRLNFRQAFR